MAEWYDWPRERQEESIPNPATCGAKPATRQKAQKHEAPGTIPANLKEQLAMQQAKSDPGAGTRIPITMNDPRWPASQGWVKMQQDVNGVTVHYDLNTQTGETADWKFKP